MALLRVLGIGSFLLIAACARASAPSDGASDSAAADTAHGQACGLDEDEDDPTQGSSTHYCAAAEFCDDDLAGICLPLSQQGPRCGMMPSGETPFFCLSTEYCADERVAKCQLASWKGDECGQQPSGAPRFCEVGERCYEGAVCTSD